MKSPGRSTKKSLREWAVTLPKNHLTPSAIDTGNVPRQSVAAGNFAGSSPPTPAVAGTQ